MDKTNLQKTTLSATLMSYYTEHGMSYITLTGIGRYTAEKFHDSHKAEDCTCAQSRHSWNGSTTAGCDRWVRFVNYNPVLTSPTRSTRIINSNVRRWWTSWNIRIGVTYEFVGASFTKKQHMLSRTSLTMRVKFGRQLGFASTHTSEVSRARQQDCTILRRLEYL